MSSLIPNRPTARLGVEKLEDRVNPAGEFSPNTLLVGVVAGQEAAAVDAIVRATPSAVVAPLGFGAYRVDLPAGVTVPEAIGKYSGQPGVRYAEPDYVITPDRSPNDPEFTSGALWAPHNYGQDGGTAGADYRGLGAWDLQTGTRQTIVAVLDDGIDYTHPDLAANMWTGPGGIHGFDFVDNDSDPMPEAGDEHGTHVAGTVGAVGNNGIGVAGVNWNTRLMGLKIYSATGPATTAGLISGAVAAFNFAVANGATILNNSWKYYGPMSQAFSDAVAGVKAAGGIVLASAGNDSMNNETYERWPSNFTLIHDNVVAVASTDRNDQLSSFSNYSATMVQLAAPGSDIVSTTPGNTYQSFSGTSMATPTVAGALSLAWDHAPGTPYRDLIDSLYRSITPVPALNGLTVTGGTLNLQGLLSSLGGSVFATAAGEGGGPHVKVYRGTGSLAGQFMAYHPSFTGGVRVATGDVTGDGFADVVTVPGPGGGPHVKVFDGRTLQEVYSFMSFEPAFRGGLTVATGDVNGDGRADVIVGAERGGGPRVAVFSQLAATAGLTRVADFFAYDPKFTGGVRVSAGVFTAGGTKADVVTAPGGGGGPHLKRFAAATISNPNPTVAMQTMVGDVNDRSGLWIAAGDLTGDGVADVAAGVGRESADVHLLDGRSLAAIHTLRNPTSGEVPGLTNPNGSGLVGSTTPPPSNNGLLAPATTPNALAFTGNPAVPVGGRFGVRVAVQDVNGDKKADLILAGGPLDSPVVSLLDGRTYATVNSYLVYDPAFFGGVYVGGVGA